MADNLQAILDRLEPEVRRAFEAAVADIRSAAQLEAVIAHIEAGNIDAALIALNLRPEFWAPLDDALTRAFNAGGVSALAGLPALSVPFRRAPGWWRASTAATRVRNAWRATFRPSW